MSKPLEEIKLIEIAQEIQGPFASLFLSDLGAEITKIENRETGDLSRWLTAGLIGGPAVGNVGALPNYIPHTPRTAGITPHPTNNSAPHLYPPTPHNRNPPPT